MNPLEGQSVSLCHFCDAACCYHVNIQLTHGERKFLGSHGTRLDFVRQGPTKETDIYYMEECAFLEPMNINAPNGRRQCSIYNSAQRPAVCSRFQPGCRECQVLRSERVGA